MDDQLDRFENEGGPAGKYPEHEDDVPGAFGPGYIYNPAVFPEPPKSEPCPHCGRVLTEETQGASTLLTCRFHGPITHKEET